MASRPHLWISVWVVFSSILVIWDVGYCLMRPRSFRGGDLHWIWKPYSLYQDIDLVYGVETYNNKHGFTSAQSVINIFEVLGNLIYTYKAHISSVPDPVAPLFGIVAASSTISKTVLYWLQEYFCDYCAVGHNDFQTLFWMWIIPNGAWLVVPSFMIVALWKDVAASLRLTAAKGHNSASTVQVSEKKPKTKSTNGKAQ